MNVQVNAYRRKAKECDAAAERVTDPEVRAVYLAIASRWLKMAERQLAIEDSSAGVISVSIAEMSPCLRTSESPRPRRASIWNGYWLSAVGRRPLAPASVSSVAPSV